MSIAVESVSDKSVALAGKPEAIDDVLVATIHHKASIMLPKRGGAKQLPCHASLATAAIAAAKELEHCTGKVVVVLPACTENMPCGTPAGKLARDIAKDIALKLGISVYIRFDKMAISITRNSERSVRKSKPVEAPTNVPLIPYGYPPMPYGYPPMPYGYPPMPLIFTERGWVPVAPGWSPQTQ